MSANGKILYVGETTPPPALDLVLEGQGYQILRANGIGAALRVLDRLDFEAMVVEAPLLDEHRDQWQRVNATHPGMPVLAISARREACRC